MFDPRVNSFRPGIFVKDNVVTLTGSVSDLAAKRAAVETAMKYNAYGVDYVENILYQTTRPRSRYQRVVLADDTLNQLQMQEPDLLIYDAITLKKRRENHDKNR